jgi:hypothetical protein
MSESVPILTYGAPPATYNIDKETGDVLSVTMVVTREEREAFGAMSDVDKGRYVDALLHILHPAESL